MLIDRLQRIVNSSVDEAYSLYDELVALVESQSQTEPEKYSTELILQIVWRKLAERFVANGFTIDDLCDLMIEDQR